MKVKDQTHNNVNLRLDSSLQKLYILQYPLDNTKLFEQMDAQFSWYESIYIFGLGSFSTWISKFLKWNRQNGYL